MLQRYVSDELTHFVGRRLSTDEERYDLLIRIVKSGELLPPQIVADRQNGPGIETVLRIDHSREIGSNEKYLDSVVCFCDIPVEGLAIHTRKYSRFGVAFHRRFLAHGASPVFYVAEQAPSRYPSTGIGALTKRDAFEAGESLQLSLGDYMWNLRESYTVEGRHHERWPKPLRDWRELRDFLYSDVLPFLKFFDATLPDADIDNYYMEREWRAQGVVAFTLADLTRILVPHAFAARLATDLPRYAGEITYLD